MDLREKIRMLGFIILILGLILAPIGLFSSPHNFTKLITYSPFFVVGASFSMFGLTLSLVSFILPRS